MKTRIIQDVTEGDEPPVVRKDAAADRRQPTDSPSTTVVRETNERPPSQPNEKGATS
jgi:hypothetical protein